MTGVQTCALPICYLKECPHCHSKNVDYLTRVIGYLRRVSNFSKPRQEEASRRFYASM